MYFIVYFKNGGVLRLGRKCTHVEQLDNTDVLKFMTKNGETQAIVPIENILYVKRDEYEQNTVIFA